MHSDWLGLWYRTALLLGLNLELGCALGLDFEVGLVLQSNEVYLGCLPCYDLTAFSYTFMPLTFYIYFFVYFYNASDKDPWHFTSCCIF